MVILLFSRLTSINTILKYLRIQDDQLTVKQCFNIKMYLI